MKWTYRYKIYPRKDRSAILDRQFILCKDPYDVALDQRRNAWKYRIRLVFDRLVYKGRDHGNEAITFTWKFVNWSIRPIS